MKFLKQSTEQIVHLNWAVDKADANTAVTSITPDTLKVAKHGATALTDISSTASLTHIEGGIFRATLSTSDTNTVGHLTLYLSDKDNIVDIYHEFQVLAANAYDALHGADVLQADVTQVAGSSVSGVNDFKATGFSTHSAADVWTESGRELSTPNNYKADVSGLATSAALATVDGNVDAILVDTNEMQGKLPASTIAAASDVPDAAAIADAVWDEALAGHVGAGSAGEAAGRLDADVSSRSSHSAADVWSVGTREVTGGTVGTATSVTNAVTVGTINANAVNASALATDAVSEIQSGLATSAEIAALDTVVDRVEADTQDIQGRLPAALVSGRIAADAVAISGSTTAADNVEANIGNLDASIAGLNDPTAAAIADAVWDEALADHAGVGSTGEALDAASSGGSAPSAADIADAVWDEALSGHTTAGSAGKTLSDAGSAGDPWSTALPGAYGAGTAGNIVGNLNDLSAADVNAEVDSALADYDAPTKAELDAGLAALNDLSAAEVNAQVDAALADYDAPTKAELDSGLAALNDPTAAAIADAVWDEAMADHLTGGTTGASLNGAGSAGDPWTTALPGAYGAGTAGNIVGNLNDLSAADVNAEVDSALADYDAPTKAELDSAIAGLNDISTGDVNTQVAAALATYDAATGTDVTNATSPLATAASVAALNDLSAADVNAQVDSALADYDAPTKAELDAGLAALNDLSTADVLAQVTAGLNSYDPPTNAELTALIGGLNDFDPASDAVANVTTVGSVTGTVDANVTQITGNSAAAAKLLNTLTVVLSGTVGATTTTTTISSAALTSTLDDAYVGRTIYFTSGTLTGVAASISAFDPDTDVITFGAVPVAPSTGDSFLIY